jgi:hypothetical protein
MVAGRVGLSETEFWQTTPRYLANRVDGYFQAEEERERAAWERARYTAFFSLKPHDQKKRINRFKDLGLFPWENPAGGSLDLSVEELADSKNRVKEAALKEWGSEWIPPKALA